MKFIRLFLLLISYVVLDARFSLYYSDGPHSSYVTFDCLYAHVNDDPKNNDEPFTRSTHLIPYCRRPDINEEQETISFMNSDIGKVIRFDDLNKNGVTSAHLLRWFAPIDIAERYEKNGSNSEDVFYNCTSPWFGSTCQYTFDYDTPSLFGDIVDATLADHDKEYQTIENSTCYPFLTNCYRGPPPTCLDWREICNGISDCINGEDEEFCAQLELNKCTDEEYRCHYGGQCIPLIFVHDGSRNSD